METEKFEPRKAVATLSNAMDVGNPSNFIRILEIFDHDFPELSKKLSAYSITDEETIQAMKLAWHKFHYVLDPHGAVAYVALNNFLEKRSGLCGMVLETAHPAKFHASIMSILPGEIAFPPTMKALFSKEKQSIKMKASYSCLKDYLLSTQ